MMKENLHSIRAISASALFLSCLGDTAGRGCFGGDGGPGGDNAWRVGGPPPVAPWGGLGVEPVGIGAKPGHKLTFSSTKCQSTQP